MNRTELNLNNKQVGDYQGGGGLELLQQILNDRVSAVRKADAPPVAETLDLSRMFNSVALPAHCSVVV